MNRRGHGKYWLALITIFTGLYLLWFMFPRLTELLELQAEDRLQSMVYELYGAKKSSPDIIHIDFDDSMLSSKDHSTSDLRTYSQLIEVLNKAGVSAILIDRIFTSASDEVLLEELAEQIKQAGNVYLPVVMKKTAGSNYQSSSQGDLQYLSLSGVKQNEFPNGEVLLGNPSDFESGTAGLGHINCWPDPDGVYRRCPLLIESEDGFVSVLALRLISDYLGVNPESIYTSGAGRVVLPGALYPGGVEKDIVIPVDEDGYSRIHFLGPWPETFAHYSVKTILEKGATDEGIFHLQDELEETLIIISDVSTAGRDYGPIPFSSYSPLSGLHSHLMNMILTENFLLESGWKENLLLELVLLLLLLMIARLARGSGVILLSVVLLVILWLGQVWIMLSYNYFTQLVRPAMLVIFGAMSIIFVQFYREQKEKLYVKGRLGSYFAPSVMKIILDDPEKLETVKKKKLTILFADIVGFSTWSSTREADEIHQMLSSYFREMATILFNHKGTIDNYMGDGLIAFFGDPVEYEDHAEMAVKAAIAMQKRVKGLAKEWLDQGRMDISIRIGVHTGLVVVGNMGSRERMQYTVIGSNVNLAQRMESNCPQGSILVSRQVRDELQGSIHTEAAGKIEMKGFDQPVEVFTVKI